MSAGLKVLYEDKHVLAFDKPSGLAVQGGSGVRESLEDLLRAYAKSNGKAPRLVHRLDQETSGVIIVARTKPAAAFFSEAFAGRDVEKRYVALACGGALTPPSGVIDAPLRKAQRKGLDIMEVARAGEPAAQSARTAYQMIDASALAALVSLAPETGRMHQLRAHLASLGRPIAGDGKYGGLFALGAVAIPRLLLHAAAIDAPHPDGGRIVIDAPLPRDFAAVLEALGLSQP